MTAAASIVTRFQGVSADAIRALADRLDTTTDAIIGDAVAAYLAERGAFLDFLQVGIDAADQGDLIAQNDIEAWFEARHRSAAAE